MDKHTLISIVDDDAEARQALRLLLETANFAVKEYNCASAFLDDDVFEPACLIADLVMPAMDGLALQSEVNRRRRDLPVIIVSGFGEVDLAVQAMKAGAVDFLEKPVEPDTFLTSVYRALSIGEKARDLVTQNKAARKLVSALTPREKNVMDELVAGLSNKAVAEKLGISPRTVEVYRAQIMNKLQADSMSDLVRTALAASTM